MTVEALWDCFFFLLDGGNATFTDEHCVDYVDIHQRTKRDWCQFRLF
jgi:hypothetical protein